MHGTSSTVTKQVGQGVEGGNFVWMSPRYGREFATMLGKCTFPSLYSFSLSLCRPEYRLSFSSSVPRAYIYTYIAQHARARALYPSLLDGLLNNKRICIFQQARCATWNYAGSSNEIRIGGGGGRYVYSDAKLFRQRTTGRKKSSHYNSLKKPLYTEREREDLHTCVSFEEISRGRETV